MQQRAPETASDEGTVRSLKADLPVNVTLHVWLKAQADGTPGELRLANAKGPFATLAAVNAEEHSFRIYHIFGGGEVEFAWDTEATGVSVIYWFTAADVIETGIQVLYTGSANAPPDLASGYHFRPPFGWMNDPNGFGRFGGRPHLFYQHYSHGLRWNTMHWGHAVSDDYLRWRHLPIFLFPSEDLTARPDRRGGAFSGSAIPIEDTPGIRVFFTEQVADRKPEQQIQLTATSADLIMAGEATVILGERPLGEGLTQDFRDPYVFRGPDGLWKMLLGSQSDEGGAILLYETRDEGAAAGWAYLGKLFVERRMKTSAIECPCLLPLDGPVDGPGTRWVLIYGLMHSEHAATGRRNLTMAEVGRFDGRRFMREFEQELDFGTDCYAFQAFDDGGEAIGIGWLANWADAAPDIDFPSAMTLPRRLLLAGDTLLTPPVATVETLRTTCLDDRRLARGETIAFGGNSGVEIAFTLAEAGAPFLLELGHPSIRLALSGGSGGLEILHGPEGQGPRYRAENAKAGDFRIFLDHGSVEVFADGGRWTGTKRLDGFTPVASARLSAPPGSVTKAEIWSLQL